MKRHCLHTFALSVVIFLLTLPMLVGCDKLIMEDDDCVGLIHDARDALHDMDYATAEQKLHKVLEHSSNRMHRVSADLMMMRVCLLKSDSKGFYDYRNDAEKCMQVLKNDEAYMNDSVRWLWYFTQESYYQLSVVYFNEVRQNKDVHEMLDSIRRHPEWNDGDTLGFRERLQPRELMLTQDIVSDADLYCENGDYFKALELLAGALHKINVHHLKYNKGVAPDDTLFLMGDVNNDAPTEMRWISDPDIVAIPTWMAMVREELSIVYGAMGDKEASNYNRNIYFDILDATRQDMQMAQREDTLKAQDRFLNLLIILLVSFAAVVVITLYILSKRIDKQSKEKREKLQASLDICSRMVNGEDVEDDIRALLPQFEGDWTAYQPSGRKGKSYEREILSLLQVFDTWMKHNKEMYDSLYEQKESLESEIYMEQRRMDDNKRRHIDRSTAISIVQGITPFLDRAIHQVEKGEGYADRDLLRQFVEKINAYNDVLGHWVKVKQGSVVLNIENFSLAPLLETMQKGHRTFDSKKISLSVDVVDATVKADKALTLFMMNTLLDNARKYTPEGGSVSLSVDCTDTYVELSVKDTGNGLSAEDQNKINNMKVYDSSQIGIDNDKDGSIKQNKGFGFGLMNCRGIIEKYRKTGRMFDVCQFGVESVLGEGSRFYFRLPNGVKRALSILLFVICGSSHLSAQSFKEVMDSVYSSNVNGEYQKAVEFANTAISVLNAEYILQSGDDEHLMNLYGTDGYYAELEWYEKGVDLDYNMIISLRNEVALASLSIPDKKLYLYNNEAFIRLNKLVTHDPAMEEMCAKLAGNNANKNLVFAITLIILLIGSAVYAMMYYHYTVYPVFNMRQLVEFLKKLFSAKEEELPQLFFQSVNNIHPADAIKVHLSDGRKFEVGSGFCDNETTLSLVFEGEKYDVGKLLVAYHGSVPTPEERIIIDFFAKFASIHTFFASVKVEQQHDVIELLEESRFATETEQQRLHVQNMVLDNCLSTIKHETMYYPNRILQLLDSSDKMNVEEIRDVLKFYREVFSLLSENANRQLSRSIVKLQKLELADVAKYAKKSFDRQNKKLMLPLKFIVTGEQSGAVRTDIVLFQYLLDTLISVAFEQKSEGNIELNFEKSEGFIKFALSDTRVTRSEEENATLFYADSVRYDSMNDMLIGAQYLIAKQIIRDHDERLGHRGCRIYAEGNKVVFMLPC